MAFSSLSQSARARILLELKGAAKYVADATKASLATQRLAMATKEQEVASTRATRATFLHAQAIYTLRRYAFYGTLALVGIGAAALRMGFNFDTAMQTTTVSMEKFVGGMQNARKEANYLYVLAAKTPFEFTDLSLAARRLLPAFNGNLQQTNEILVTIGDALAGFGITSASALQRSTLAIAHMMNIGRLTGQVLYQMARDNIPMQKALEQAFGATGLQIKEAVARGAISAQDAITALNRYISNPANGFHNAAQRLGLRTLQGNFTTFHDLVAASFGSAEMGGFTSITKHFREINTALINIVQSGKKLTLMELVKAIDSSLTPSTHRIMFAFITLKTAMEDVWHSVQFGMKVLNAILWPITQITGLFGGASSAAKNMGHFIALLIDLLIIEKSVMFLAALAIDAYKIATWGVTTATKLWRLGIKALLFWQGLEETMLVTQKRTHYDLATAELVHKGRMADFARVIKTKTIPALVAWTVTQWGLFTALLGTEVTIAGITLILGAWIAIIVAIVAGLVLLYFKWKPFRDLVNQTATWIWKNWTYMGLFFGLAIYAIGMIIKHWDGITGAISDSIKMLERFYNWLMKIANLGGHHSIKKFLKNTALGTFSTLDPIGLAFMAEGGTVSHSGLTVVGEKGPELLSLPKGAQVTPMQSPQPAFASLVSNTSSGGSQPVVVQLVLRDRVVEQVMVDIMEKRNARR